MVRLELWPGTDRRRSFPGEVSGGDVRNSKTTLGDNCRPRRRRAHRLCLLVHGRVKSQTFLPHLTIT